MFVLNEKNPMENILQDIQSFTIYRNGDKIAINKDTKRYKLIMKVLDKLISEGRIMPAFGVSLHDETQNAMKHGKWLQINFNTEHEIDGLPFEALLIKLEPTSGVNLIRLYNGKYEGRCIYLEFDEELNTKSILRKLS